MLRLRGSGGAADFGTNVRCLGKALLETFSNLGRDAAPDSIFICVFKHLRLSGNEYIEKLANLVRGGFARTRRFNRIRFLLGVVAKLEEFLDARRHLLLLLLLLLLRWRLLELRIRRSGTQRKQARDQDCLAQAHKAGSSFPPIIRVYWVAYNNPNASGRRQYRFWLKSLAKISLTA
ncbi:MAG TPA: hypothetical protein VKG24_13125 [Pseudolabrys sp.]|nr:hypothetical protein [Pseudolabrys sp.]